MPVLDFSRDVDNRSGGHLDRILSPLLIVASSAYADQHLPAAVLCVVDVPVVPAAGLKGNVIHCHLLSGHRCQIALSHKKLSVGILLSYREKYFFLEFFFCHSFHLAVFQSNIYFLMKSLSLSGTPPSSETYLSTDM